MAVINCPNCQGKLKFPDDSPARRVKCTMCSYEFIAGPHGPTDGSGLKPAANTAAFPPPPPLPPPARETDDVVDDFEIVDDDEPPRSKSRDYDRKRRDDDDDRDRDRKRRDDEDDRDRDRRQRDEDDEYRPRSRRRERDDDRGYRRSRYADDDFEDRPRRRRRRQISLIDSIPIDNVTQAIIGIGIGFVFNAAVGADTQLHFLSVATSLVLTFLGSAFSVWGCAAYAKMKGLPEPLGLFGLLGCCGLIIIALIPGNLD